MNLRHYMLEICLKVSMKVTYMNYSLKNYVTNAGKQLAGERVGDVSGEISYAHFLEIWKICPKIWEKKNALIVWLNF